MRWVRDWVRKHELESGVGGVDWEPSLQAVGLQKVKHPTDGSLWVSEERAEEYLKQGKKALAAV